MNPFLLMLNQTLCLFVMIALGYFLNKKKILPPSTKDVLSRLATRVLLPALICDSFIENCSLDNLITYSSYILAGGIVMFACVFISLPLCDWLTGKNGTSYEKGIYRYCLSIPNASAFGIPVVQALYGSEGLFQFNLFLTVGNIVCYTWAINQLIPKSGVRKSFLMTLKDAILNPIILSMLIGILIAVTGLTAYIPSFILTSMDKLANCYSVPCLILVGFSIAEFNLKEILANKKVYFMTFFRLILIPALFLIFGKLFHVSYQIMLMTILFMACPCGMNSVVFPAAYGQDVRPSSGIVLVTSLLAVLTIPLFYSLV